MRNLIVFVLFAFFFIIDIFHDVKEGIPVSHIWHEVALFLLAMGAIAWQLRVIFQKNVRITSLNSELLETKKSYQEWKEKTHSSALEIRQLIDSEFGLWHLSHSEKDVALLLIKGLSMKEIADIRQTHEKTVRQQATSIYKKSGLSGRQELAAFFLEDILSLPINPA
jgi:DNA-binding CsgD family transcriptional regulator